MSRAARQKRKERAAWVGFLLGQNPRPMRPTSEQRALARLEVKAKTRPLSMQQKLELKRLRAKSAEATAA